MITAHSGHRLQPAGPAGALCCACLHCAAFLLAVSVCLSARALRKRASDHASHLTVCCLNVGSVIVLVAAWGLSTAVSLYAVATWPSERCVGLCFCLP